MFINVLLHNNHDQTAPSLPPGFLLSVLFMFRWSNFRFRCRESSCGLNPPEVLDWLFALFRCFGFKMLLLRFSESELIR